MSLPPGPFWDAWEPAQPARSPHIAAATAIRAAAGTRLGRTAAVLGTAEIRGLTKPSYYRT
ncbi:hypothetical protein GCM10022416_46080 [Actinomadura keratinilytica]|uniref:Transcriptional regulator n=1 Tax=Actinomadura keratinilytica TaxID=547461 RepID=A0ABP7Z915_9ACTN